MGWETLILAALGGAIVGLLLTLFGGGGSVLATPWLVYVVGVADTHVAIGTSAAAVAVNAAIGLAAQARASQVKGDHPACTSPSGCGRLGMPPRTVPLTLLARGQGP